MTDYVYLSTTAVAIILVGVALLAMIVALALYTFGDPERSYRVVLFVCLAAIWTMAVNKDFRKGQSLMLGSGPFRWR